MERFLRVYGLAGRRFRELRRDLMQMGIQLLWISESENETEVGILYSRNAKELLERMNLKFEELSSQSIDWESQWASFARGEIYDGVYEIEFQKLGVKAEGSFLMKAGPGFGDLSHPTTQLMLNLMACHCQGRDCIDIGSGSGVLTVAALKMGAVSVNACDIDEAAVLHTRENIALNHFEENASAYLPEEMWKSVFKEASLDPVILINMIEGEQRQALPWDYLKKLPAYTLIASGLLKGREEGYLNWVESFGSRLHSSMDSGEWSAHIFKFSSGSVVRDGFGTL